jgi:hypothetical protein
VINFEDPDIRYESADSSVIHPDIRQIHPDVLRITDFTDFTDEMDEHRMLLAINPNLIFFDDGYALNKVCDYVSVLESNESYDKSKAWIPIKKVITS